MYIVRIVINLFTCLLLYLAQLQFEIYDNYDDIYHALDSSNCIVTSCNDNDHEELFSVIPLSLFLSLPLSLSLSLSLLLSLCRRQVRYAIRNREIHDSKLSLRFPRFAKETVGGISFLGDFS